MKNHPVIENMERTGWAAGREPAVYRCPNCDGILVEGEQVYIQDDGKILGCSACVFAAHVDEAMGGNDL